MPPAKSRQWAAQGKRIAEAREVAVLDQGVVATAAGVNVKTVSKWENGWQNPHDNQLAKVAELLGRPVRWFRFGTEPAARTPEQDTYAAGYAAAMLELIVIDARRIAERAESARARLAGVVGAETSADPQFPEQPIAPLVVDGDAERKRRA